MNRVAQLAGRPSGVKPAKAIPYKSLIPLEEVIADTLKVGAGTKRVAEHYKELIKSIGSEFKVLLEAKREDIMAASLPEIAEAVIRVRQGKVNVSPGYDGEFGKISIFGKEEKKGSLARQKTLL